MQSRATAYGRILGRFREQRGGVDAGFSLAEPWLSLIGWAVAGLGRRKARLLPAGVAVPSARWSFPVGSAVEDW